VTGAAATAIHALVDSCRRGAHPPAVARVPSGWVVLGEQQVLPGYCLLLPDPVVPNLNALEAGSRRAFLDDMARLGDALMLIMQAVRINYAIFGNVEPALHAHVFPRLAAEPDAVRSVQPWALDWSAAPTFSAARDGALQRRLAAELERTSL
jgi:diadenosine tetraphosphate (Ap4A) HIT family hydrolase